MKSIYLAGPINGCNDTECNDWRAKAKSHLSDRYIILNPMNRDFRGKEDISIKEIVEGDKLDVLKADIILADCSRNSAGTSMEVLLAWQNQKTVITFGGLSPWIKYHSTYYVETLNDALTVIDDGYNIETLS
jgi:nucleoside 2-deoxyribosyltransferase